MRYNLSNIKFTLKFISNVIEIIIRKCDIMKKILVCEDETVIRDFVVINLRRAGYDVVEADCGEKALEEYENYKGGFDVAILDVMMPGIDGFTVCKELRAKNSNLGIIMLSAKTQEMDKVTGLMLGADDYVAKPFSPSELVARVDALYRRIAIAEERANTNFKEELKSGDFVLNLRSRTLRKNGKLIELTQVEFQMMEYFLTHPAENIDRTEILNHVWGEAYAGEEKIVDVNIRRLRMKVEDDPSCPKFIVTVWGLGYKWNIK